MAGDDDDFMSDDGMSVEDVTPEPDNELNQQSPPDPDDQSPQDLDDIETEDHGEDANKDGPDADQPSAEPEKPKPSKRNRVQDRMDELTREKYEAQRELEELKRENAQLKGESGNKGNEPQPEDFPTYEAYEEALEKWEKNPGTSDADKEPLTDQQLLIRTTISEIDNNAALWDERPDDYHDIMAKGEFNMNEATLLAIGEMEDSAQVMYHIATNPEIADKVVNCRTEARRVNILDQISKDLGATAPDPEPEPKSSPKPAKRKRQPAYEPQEPLGGNKGNQMVDLNEASFSDFEKEVNKQESESQSGW